MEGWSLPYSFDIARRFAKRAVREIARYGEQGFVTDGASNITKAPEAPDLCTKLFDLYPELPYHCQNLFDLFPELFDLHPELLCHCQNLFDLYTEVSDSYTEASDLYPEVPYKVIIASGHPTVLPDMYINEQKMTLLEWDMSSRRNEI